MSAEKRIADPRPASSRPTKAANKTVHLKKRGNNRAVRPTRMHVFTHLKPESKGKAMSTKNTPYPPNFDCWVAYCKSCEADRIPRLAKEMNRDTGAEYYDLVCTECYWIMLTISPR